MLLKFWLVCNLCMPHGKEGLSVHVYPKTIGLGQNIVISARSLVFNKGRFWYPKPSASHIRARWATTRCHWAAFSLPQRSPPTRSLSLPALTPIQRARLTSPPKSSLSPSNFISNLCLRPSTPSLGTLSGHLLWQFLCWVSSASLISNTPPSARQIADGSDTWQRSLLDRIVALRNLLGAISVQRADLLSDFSIVRGQTKYTCFFNSSIGLMCDSGDGFICLSFAWFSWFICWWH